MEFREVLRRGGCTGPPYWFVDAGAVMMAVLMAAIDEGLASTFIGHPRQKEVLHGLLGLPPEVVPIGVALVGKPGEAPDISSRLRAGRRHSGRLGGSGLVTQLLDGAVRQCRAAPSAMDQTFRAR